MLSKPILDPLKSSFTMLFTCQTQ